MLHRPSPLSDRLAIGESWASSLHTLHEGAGSINPHRDELQGIRQNLLTLRVSARKQTSFQKARLFLGAIDGFSEHHYAGSALATSWGALSVRLGGQAMEILKVASRSNPNSVAGAIAGALEQDRAVEVHAIGAGAVNQTVKAIAIARRLIERDGASPIKVVPGFIELQIDGATKTGMRFIVEK